MRYIATPPTTAIASEEGTFVADADGYFDLTDAPGVASAFARHGITLTPHADDLAAQDAAKAAGAEAERLAAEEAALAAQLAADAEGARIFDEAVERKVQERLAAEASRSKKAPAPKPAD